MQATQEFKEHATQVTQRILTAQVAWNANTKVYPIEEGTTNALFHFLGFVLIQSSVRAYALATGARITQMDTLTTKELSPPRSVRRLLNAIRAVAVTQEFVTPRRAKQDKNASKVKAFNMCADKTPV